jgi:hypothetical protein
MRVNDVPLSTYCEHSASFLAYTYGAPEEQYSSDHCPSLITLR